MAIYYINPHTLINGTGTWASPWSLASATRTGLASGDEIRIKGVALTSLLTATSYTATVTSNYQLTITAGGGLGADWGSGSVGYLPDYDTFFKVQSKSGNVIQILNSTSMLPIKNWSITSLTVRLVDSSLYDASSDVNSFNIGNSSALNNITVSDCWTSASTRVTDGTVKTLINSSYSSGAISFYADRASATGAVSGWTLNLQNTHVMSGTGNSPVNTNIGSSSSTYNFNQIFSASSVGQGFYFNGTVNNSTINVNHFTNYYGIGNSIYGENNTFNITYLVTYASRIFGNAFGITSPNNTFNITNYSFNYATTGGLIESLNSAKFTVNLTGVVDQYGSSPASSVVYGYGEMSLTIGAGVTYYYNKRASTQSAWPNYCVYAAGQSYASLTIFPKITISNSWTRSGALYNTTSVYPAGMANSGLPQEVTILFPVNSLTTNTPYGVNSNTNALVVFGDNAAPKEILGVFQNGLSSSNASNNYPIVTTDAIVYKTTGPSLKSYLQTFDSTFWKKSAKSIKTIKIPCVSGTSYTVSGYIRTDDTAYANNDCRIGIYLNNAEVTGQNMTTSCINAWEQFTLTFTASTTGEYVLAWSMYYANGAKSYWLDDLTIS